MSKALVLSGGGSVGIAWQTGLIAGLARRGVDLGAADFILGTSAGSAVGAQLALGRDLEARVERYQGADTRNDPTSTGGADPGMAERMVKFMAIMEELADAEPVARRAAIGRFALSAPAMPEEQFVGVFSYLRGESWPSRYACTAVDAESGEFTVFDERAGAELDRAVASSCAVPGLFSPISIAGHRYMDGGMRSGANTDLAAGHDRVLLVTLMTPERLPAGDARAARFFEAQESESKALADAGSLLQVVGPDAGAAAAMGINLMDASVAPVAALEGLRQGESAAEQVAAFWL
jgi:NTE family protein